MSEADRPRAGWGTLTRERVIAAALALVDEAGVEGLTMKAVADHLSVGTMSIYRHVRDRDDLLDGIAEALADEIVIPMPVEGDWRTRVMELARSMRRVALLHPSAFPLLELRPTLTERTAARQAEALAILRDAGIPDVADQAILARTIVSYVTGFVLAEISGRADFPGEPAAPVAFENGLRIILDGAGPVVTPR